MSNYPQAAQPLADRVIAGQEMGTKKQHLALAAKGKYPPDRILMIGDAPGDLEAARERRALLSDQSGQRGEIVGAILSGRLRPVHGRHVCGRVRSRADRRAREAAAGYAAVEAIGVILIAAQVSVR